jgi:hypothetical protein
MTSDEDADLITGLIRANADLGAAAVELWNRLRASEVKLTQAVELWNRLRASEVKLTQEVAALGPQAIAELRQLRQDVERLERENARLERELSGVGLEFEPEDDDEAL